LNNLDQATKLRRKRWRNNHYYFVGVSGTYTMPPIPITYFW